MRFYRGLVLLFANIIATSHRAPEASDIYRAAFALLVGLSGRR